MNITWSAAAAAIAAASVPGSHAFVAITPPSRAGATEIAAETPFFVSVPSSTDDRILILQAQLEEAREEAARWRKECEALRSGTMYDVDSELRILEVTARMEEEKLRVQLEAIASIDALQAGFNSTMEESQQLIDSLRRALESDESESEVNGEEMADDGNGEISSAAEAVDAVTADKVEEITMEGTTLKEEDAFGITTEDNSLDNGNSFDGKHGLDDEESASLAAAREEDLELTRRAIMDFVMQGLSEGDEDAFVLKKTENNVEYIERIENRAKRRMSLRERLMEMDKAGEKKAVVPRKAAEVRPNYSAKRRNLPSEKRRERDQSLKRGGNSAPRKAAMSLRELALRS